MEIEPPFLHECFKEFLNYFCLQIDAERCIEIDLVYKVRTPGEIDHDTRERLIQRDVCMREACNAAAIPTSFVKRLPQDPTNIFDGMVAVDFEIAFRRDIEI